MGDLSTIEAAAIERAGAEPMLAQVEAWAAINSGSRNLAGLAEMAGLFADAFSALPGKLDLLDPVHVDAMREDGSLQPIEHGRNLHLAVRPNAPVQLLFTGHMDTVYAADHPFQQLAWRADGTLGGPGVADMKGGLAVLLAALKAVEASPLAAGLGYEVVINSDEEVGSPGSAALIAAAARGKRAALTYEPSAFAPTALWPVSRPGSGNFSIRVQGRSAHAGRNPAGWPQCAGRSRRSRAASRQDQGLRPVSQSGPHRRWQPRTMSFPISPYCGSICARSGKPIRIAPRPQLEEALAEVAARHQVRIDLHGGWGRAPKPLSREAEHLFSLVARCGADLGQTIRLARQRRRLRRQQHRRLRRACRRYHGRARRRHSLA
jgi:glutamate carboxypeptidase